MAEWGRELPDWRRRGRGPELPAAAAPGKVGARPGEGPRAARARPRRGPRAPPRCAAGGGRGGSARLQPVRGARCSLPAAGQWGRRAPRLSPPPPPPPRHTAGARATESGRAPAAVCALEAPGRAGRARPPSAGTRRGRCCPLPAASVWHAAPALRPATLGLGARSSSPLLGPIRSFCSWFSSSVQFLSLLLCLRFLK